MAYPKRTPPVKLVISKEQYNSLVERVMIDEQLKGKLLRYSVPKEDNSILNVEIGLFPDEAASLIKLLITSPLSEEVTIDYYSVLVKVHKQLFKIKD